MRKWLLLLLCAPVFTRAQKLPSIEAKTKGLKEYPGFLNFYWNDSTGAVLLEIDRPDSEMLYLTSLAAGLGSNDIGLDRGLQGDARIVKFSRVGNKVLLTESNYRYRAVSPDMAEQRAVRQSFAQSVLWGFKVEAATGDHVLVDITDFLLRDAMEIGPLLKKQKQGSYNPDKTRSAIYLPDTKNFPRNTELEATVTFVSKDGEVGNEVSSVTPFPEAITLRLHQSFVQLPDNGYQPRIFDPRSGFIPVSFDDYGTPVSQPLTKYYIIRHRLQKKDPGAEISEPVQPIVYYLDNGTPEPIRSALLEGARWWEQAFEAAGFKNAFQVKILPDSADPMDIRYNMINWVHRSTRGWSYGASVVDPRTGEIIKGNVTLGSLRVRQDYLIAQGLLAPFAGGTPARDEMMQMALHRLRQLAAHEVGHTLGLMHNFAASAHHRASVMDYPPPLVKLDAKGAIDLDSAYETGIGEWDKVAINWGYRQFPKGANEAGALDGILENAAQKGLPFISDRDARAAGGLHPQAHLWDNGSDPVAELKEVMKVRARALAQFGEDDIRPGTSMAMLEDVLVPVYFFNRYQLEAVTKMVGGLYYTYALRGDGQVVTKALSKTEQRRALDAVLDCLDPASLEIPYRIVKLIPPRPAGYAYTPELFHKRTGLAFDALSPAESMTGLVFSFLFNPERMNRMVEYQAENGGLGLDEMIGQTIDRTWKAPLGTGMEALIQWQTRQLLLTCLLTASRDGRLSYPARAVVGSALNSLKEYIESQKKAKQKEKTNQAELMLALKRIRKPREVKPALTEEMPPGSPIGEEGGEE